MTAALATPAAHQHDAADSFTFADYVTLFAYDGPRRPEILGSDLVSWVDRRRRPPGRPYFPPLGPPSRPATPPGRTASIACGRPPRPTP